MVDQERVVGILNKLGILLGVIVLGVALALSPMPLTVSLQDPARDVVIYPNVLFAVPPNPLGGALIALRRNRRESTRPLRVTKS